MFPLYAILGIHPLWAAEPIVVPAGAVVAAVAGTRRGWFLPELHSQRTRHWRRLLLCSGNIFIKNFLFLHQKTSIEPKLSTIGAVIDGFLAGRKKLYKHVMRAKKTLCLTHYLVRRDSSQVCNESVSSEFPIALVHSQRHPNSRVNARMAKSNSEWPRRRKLTYIEGFKDSSLYDAAICTLHLGFIRHIRSYIHLDGVSTALI